MFDDINFYAGKKALGLIRENGIDPETIKVIPGAAGGPKWLVLNQLDRFIFGSWLTGRTRTLFLLGASIGSWRFAAACQKDPLAAIDAFEEAYIGQRYSAEPTLEEIAEQTGIIQDIFIPETKVVEILNHPCYRLGILTTRCRWPASQDNKLLQGLAFGVAAGLNTAHRSLLRVFFDRVLLYDPRQIPPYFNMNQFPIFKIPLEENNLKQALVASGSIPLVMPGVRDLPGGPRGVYRDAGIIDYHLDIPFLKEDGLVFYPHFDQRLIPGWLDKKLTWRRPQKEHLDNAVVVCPSADFVKNLPLGKIPDRNDFWLFKGKDDERMVYWREVVKQGRRLAQAFEEAVTTNRIKELVRPMPERM